MSNQTTKQEPESPYAAIGDYALIGDCHTAALVSRHGSIDWCCLPRFDSASCFGRLLDHEKGGFCLIAPVDSDFKVTRRYLEDTLVLETTFESGQAELRLFDAFTMRSGGRERPFRQLVRILECRRGSAKIQSCVAPRFDYGAVRPWVRAHRSKLFTAIGGSAGLVICGDFPFAIADHSLEAEATVQAGDRLRMSIEFEEPQRLYPRTPSHCPIKEIDHRMEQTIEWWREWVSQATPPPRGTRDELVRSAIVLKALNYAPTGAIAAAPTTSLPEAPGGERNWDYRYTWIRDSAYALDSLGELGFKAEAQGFRYFVERTAAGNAEDLQVLYGIGGEHRIAETTLDWLSGYRGAKPVRVGNAAQPQLQLDIYGELLNLAWHSYQAGNEPDDAYWRFLVLTVQLLEDRCWHPDRGIWEMRGDPEHFVHSKVLCWTAFDRAVKLAEGLGRHAPIERWTATRNKLREAIETRGYDQKRGVFVQSFDGTALDAALLQLPRAGFVAWTDERMVRTVDAICDELMEDGLLLRYRGEDGLSGEEGTFLACTFWLAECLARQGRIERAHKAFDSAYHCANDLGLLSEEFLPRKQEMLGNFPQGLSHYAHIAAALALCAAEGECDDGSTSNQ